AALERTYALRTSEATVGPDELASLSPNEHREMFMAFVAGLLREFDRYLERGEQIDLIRDGVSYGLSGIWLSKAEVRKLTQDLNDVLLPLAANTARRGRRRWYFGSIVLPAPEQPPS